MMVQNQLQSPPVGNEAQLRQQLLLQQRLQQQQQQQQQQPQQFNQGSMLGLLNPQGRFNSPQPPSAGKYFSCTCSCSNHQSLDYKLTRNLIL